MAIMINTNFRLAKESLRRNRGRTFLSALGIAIGVASIVLILSLTGGINRLISTNDDKNNANLILVRPNNNRDLAKNIVEELSDGNKYAKSNLTLEDIDEIRKLDNVAKVAPIAISSSSIVANDKTHGPYNVLATNPDLSDVVNLPLYKGEHFTADSQPNSAVIGYDAAMSIYGGPDAITKTFIYNNQRFIITGVLEKIDDPINYNGTDFDNTILINVDFAKTFESTMQIQQIDIRTATTGEVKETAEKINGLLSDRKKGTETYQVITGSEDLHPAGSLLSIVSTMLTIVAGISIVVGGVGIMNIMLVSVSERTREIGIRKALGATAGNILSQFLFESTILSVSGGIMGFALGYVGAFLIQLVTPFAPHISWQIVGITTVVSLVTGIIFGIYPAIKAASKDPIVSLKFYR
jgi:ABC-type antimicrobial peptide transport system permease subunit